MHFKNNNILVIIGLLLVLILVNENSFSREDDSLELKLRNATGTERVDLLIHFSRINLNKKPVNSIKPATEAFELSNLQSDSIRISRSLFTLGEAYRILGDNTLALDSYTKSLEISRKLNDKEGISKCTDNIGKVYGRMGAYGKAMNHHKEALSIYKELQNKTGIASALINEGIIYRNLDKPKLALENYNKALEISREIDNYELIAEAFIASGNVYYYNSNIDSAMYFYEEALNIVDEKNYIGESYSVILNNIGNIYRSKEEVQKALEYYTKSLMVSRRKGSKNLIAITMKNIGFIYKESGKSRFAIQYFKESYDIANKIRLHKVEKETLHQLSILYSSKGDYENAFEYYKKYVTLKDSIFNNENSNKVSIMQLGYKLKEQEQQRTIRQIDLELKVLKGKNLRNVIIFISIVAILLTIFIFNINRIKNNTNRELRILNSELERRVEERTKRLREENEHRRIAQEQAELANEAKNKFLATISHEVRTPINAIIGFCDLTIKSDIDKSHQKNLIRVKDSSEHLLSLIKDILDYSQFESGKMKLKHVSFNLYELIESVTNAFYLDAQTKGIKLSHEIEGNIPRFILGDPNALRQILYNLIGNAIKFTSEGFVSLNVKLVEDLSNSEKVKLNITIKDSGIGISKLKQKLIFMDFTQADNSNQRKYGGAGLGLTISKNFVELMGGVINVRSEKGKGSEFDFDIEFEIDRDRTIKKVIDGPVIKNSLNVLVAEDNLLNAQVVLAFLKRLGHKAKVANNGLEVLEIINSENFDVVLMDIEMPEMDGIQATEKIRAGEYGIKNPGIPIVALTAHALKDYEDKSFEAGMNSYLTKPVDIERLSEVLQSI